MTLSRRARSRLLLLASMSAPVLGAQALHLVGAGGPAVSSAVVTPGGGSPTPNVALVRESPVTPEQTRAIQWLRLRAVDVKVRCPMGQLAIQPLPPVILDTDPVPVPTPHAGPDPLKALAVTAIMTGDEGSLATINGKVYRLGASPLEGWTVTLIDPDQRLVKVTGANGSVVALYMKHPGPNR